MFAASLVTRLLIRPTKLSFPPCEFSGLAEGKVSLADMLESGVAVFASLSTAVES